MTAIRRATAPDLNGIHALDRDCSPVYGQVDGYAALVSDDSGLVLIAEDEAELLGCAAWSRVLDEATLINLVVAPGVRRRGTAQALLDRSREELQGLGVRRLLLELRDSNNAARRLYEIQGFELDGRRRSYYPGLNGGPREDALLMSCSTETVHACS